MQGGLKTLHHQGLDEKKYDGHYKESAQGCMSTHSKKIITLVCSLFTFVTQ